MLSVRLIKIVWYGKILQIKKEATTLLKGLPQLIVERQAPFLVDFSKKARHELGDKMIESRGNYLFRLVIPECIENKETYIPEIEKASTSLCQQATWTLFAHYKDLKTYIKLIFYLFKVYLNWFNSKHS